MKIFCLSCFGYWCWSVWKVSPAIIWPVLHVSAKWRTAHYLTNGKSRMFELILQHSHTLQPNNRNTISRSVSFFIKCCHRVSLSVRCFEKKKKKKKRRGMARKYAPVLYCPVKLDVLFNLCVWILFQNASNQFWLRFVIVFCFVFSGKRRFFCSLSAAGHCEMRENGFVGVFREDGFVGRWVRRSLQRRRVCRILRSLRRRRVCRSLQRRQRRRVCRSLQRRRVCPNLHRRRFVETICSWLAMVVDRYLLSMAIKETNHSYLE